MKSIRQQIIEVVSVTFGVPVADLNPEAPWSQVSDSLEVVELVMAIEEHFEIELPDEEVVAMKCLDDLIRAVERRLGDDPGFPVAIKPRLPHDRPSIRNPLRWKIVKEQPDLDPDDILSYAPEVDPATGKSTGGMIAIFRDGTERRFGRGELHKILPVLKHVTPPTA